MGENRVDRLTERHREVLRLYHRRLKAKEIAEQLAISVNTTNSYLTEAAGLLEAGGRAGAAAFLAAHEAAHPEARGRFSVGDASPSLPQPIVQVIEQIEPMPSWQALLPFRRGSHHNELSVLVRLFWIFVLAALLAVGFGAVADAIRVISDIVRAAGRG